MSKSRYSRAAVIDGKFFSTQESYMDLHRAIDHGLIATREFITRPKDRLDTIAGRVYGDGRYWWIIAAVNRVPWALQIPEGSRLIVPIRLEQVLSLI